MNTTEKLAENDGMALSLEHCQQPELFANILSGSEESKRYQQLLQPFIDSQKKKFADWQKQAEKIT